MGKIKFAGLLLLMCFSVVGCDKEKTSASADAGSQPNHDQQKADAWVKDYLKGTDIKTDTSASSSAAHDVPAAIEQKNADQKKADAWLKNYLKGTTVKAN